MKLRGGTTVIKTRDDVGTLGIVLRTRAGDRAFLTAGHAVDGAGTAVKVGTSPIGQVLVNLFLDKGLGPEIDLAVVRIADKVRNGDLAPMAAQWEKPSRGRCDLGGFGGRPSVGTEIAFAGARTGKHVAEISEQHARIRWRDSKNKAHDSVDVVGMKLLGAHAGTTLAGDSGGPVFANDEFIGIYTGKLASSRSNGTTHFFVPFDQFGHLVADW